jgi:hypothetical protein
MVALPLQAADWIGTGTPQEASHTVSCTDVAGNVWRRVAASGCSREVEKDPVLSTISTMPAAVEDTRAGLSPHIAPSRGTSGDATTSATVGNAVEAAVAVAGSEEVPRELYR